MVCYYVFSMIQLEIVMPLPSVKGKIYITYIIYFINTLTNQFGQNLI